MGSSFNLALAEPRPPVRHRLACGAASYSTRAASTAGAAAGGGGSDVPSAVTQRGGPVAQQHGAQLLSAAVAVAATSWRSG